MNGSLAKVLLFALYGALAAATGALFAPEAFVGSWASYIVFAVIMAASMSVGNKLELTVWRSFSPFFARNLISRVFIRIALYMGIPALAILLISLVAPALIAVPLGWVSIFRLVWMPVFVGAILRLFPARA